MSTAQPRGIRNNNPGNIRKSKDKWQGLADNQPDSDFFTFKSPEWGIRAIARILIKYQDDYDLQTITAIISRWAPTNENNTDGYIATVCKESGIGRQVPISLHDYASIFPIVKAIIHVESGVKAPYTDDQLNRGLALAGIEPPMKPISKSRTIAGTVTTAVGTAGTKLCELTGPIQEANEKLSGFTDISTIRYICLGLTIAGIVITLYAYLTDRQKRLT